MVGRGWAINLPWAPTLGLRFEMALDGLAVVYALLATGIGFLVFIYATAYLPRHLAHESRPASEVGRFWPWMILFMVAMVGLASALDLILMFVFFDLTAVASYFLIGFDRHRTEARGAAFMALLVTGVERRRDCSWAPCCSTRVRDVLAPALIERAKPSAMTTTAALLIAVAALAKSAQAPLHFWLPRAMAAPTPVSAYLHSAAMVAAGVLVIGRVHPLLALDPAVLDVLLVVGFVSIAVGGLLALAQDELKQILAYSTISQYGYVVVLYGLGGADGAVAAALYVIAHAIAKSALFMTAGAVTEATGESRLSRLGGLARDLPVLAVASGVAAASLAALPLMLGFFKDELYFAAASREGPVVAALAVAGAALTVAYLARFWLGLFVGRRRVAAGQLPLLLIAPVVVLAAFSLAGGIVADRSSAWPRVPQRSPACARFTSTPATISMRASRTSWPSRLTGSASCFSSSFGSNRGSFSPSAAWAIGWGLGGCTAWCFSASTGCRMRYTAPRSATFGRASRQSSSRLASSQPSGSPPRRHPGPTVRRAGPRC